MSNIYCGVGQIPKGKRLGSMKECAELKQIRYYGIKKIDSRLLDIVRSSKKKESRSSLLKKLVSYRAKIKVLTKKISETNDKKEKDKIIKDIKIFKEELNKISSQLKSMGRVQKKSSSKKSLKRLSKKSSRRSSKKRLLKKRTNKKSRKSKNEK